MAFFFEKSKLPLALFRLGPRRFCARGSSSEYARRLVNYVCYVRINRPLHPPVPRDLRTMFDDINNGSQNTLHRRYLVCQCSSITPHRDITPQDAAFNEEFNAWREKSEAFELARAKRRAEKKESNKRHKGRLQMAGPMPRHRQRAEMVRS